MRSFISTGNSRFHWIPLKDYEGSNWKVKAKTPHEKQTGHKEHLTKTDLAGVTVHVLKLVPQTSTKSLFFCTTVGQFWREELPLSNSRDHRLRCYAPRPLQCRQPSFWKRNKLVLQLVQGVTELPGWLSPLISVWPEKARYFKLLLGAIASVAVCRIFLG